jgi:signal transduction histidine kinase
MGVLSLARMEDSVQDPNGYLGMIESCVKKMDFYILKVIEYYKSIRVEEHLDTLSFENIIQESIDLCKMQNPLITFEVNANQPIEFKSDAFRVSMILNNLISNAVKYQKPGEKNPKVILTVDADETEARIIIEDNGVGIIDDHVNNIFQMFFRSNYNVNGLGIGLYIVKEALTRIGGEINVQSTFGEGTSFEVIVPNKAKIRALALA